MSPPQPPAARRVRVSVPATSANLGPGYDTLGLALALRDDLLIEIDPTDVAAPTRVEVTGEGAGDVPLDDSHLVASTIRSVFSRIGFPQPGLAIQAVNAIPHGQGLGSSAAAIVAGVAAALTLVAAVRAPAGDGVRSLDHAAILAIAAELEGHPDNVAPCVLGGLTIAWCDTGGVGHGVSLATAGWHPVVVIPSDRLSTLTARALLPTTVDHAVAARNVGRAALLVAVLTGQADPAHLLAATEDGLHQPFRSGAMPGASRILGDLRAAGVAAVVSGAGPSLLALLPTAGDVDVCRSVVGDRARVLPIGVDQAGVVVGPG